MARTGLQKDVLNLYRMCIRQVYRKPEPSQPNFRAFVRKSFASYSHLSRRDVSTIEFLLRKGNRMYETYSSPSVSNIS